MVRTHEEHIAFGNVELIEKGNLDVIDEIFATDYVAHSGDKEYKGHAFIKRWTKQLRSAIPDVKVVKVEVHVQAGDTIVWQRTLRGTHTANMMGALPSGKKVKWVDMVISRFEGDRIVEEWTVSELAGELLSKPPLR